MEKMMEKLSRLLAEKPDRYGKGLLLPVIPPIYSVKVLNQSNLTIRAGKSCQEEVKRILCSSFNEIINAYDYFFEHLNDPEGVHQIRVRIRRFRAVLGFFRPLFEREKYGQQQELLRKMAQQFGEVRQMDVLLEEIAVTENECLLPLGDFLTIENFLQEKRAEAFGKLLIYLETDHFAVDLLDLWVWKLNDPWEPESPLLEVTIKEYADDQLRHWVKKITKGIKKLDVKQQKAVHQIRIRSKKLRYVIEQLEGILDKKTRKSADRFEKIQDELGFYHDVFANKTLLEQLLKKSPDCQLYYQAGIILGWQLLKGNQKIDHYLK